MKKTIILTIAICSSGAIFAERNNIRDRTETWLQRENTAETSSGNLRIGAPTSDPTVPVGEGILVLTALAGLYGLNHRKNNRS
ncbi:hypothetical protein FACS189413_19280 [Bacteroidia bacterium]|nr:hypothetical protein FACS189413_19280 [Bacteroidia bacterium]